MRISDWSSDVCSFDLLSGEDAFSYAGYLAAHRNRRAFFAAMGATSTDHGHPTAATADLPYAEAEARFARVTGDKVGAADAELFGAHMLPGMAGMSLDEDRQRQRLTASPQCASR